MALQGYNVEVLDAVSGVTMTSEATSTSDNKSYQITNSAKRIIDLNTTLVVKDDGTTTTEKFTVNYLTGTIAFKTVDAGRVITITGAYLTPSTIATANSYTFSGTGDALDTTPFNTQFKSFVAGLRSGTINMGRFHVEDSLFVDALLDGMIKMIKVTFGDTYSILAYGVMTSDSIDVSPSGLVNETVTYQITNNIGVI